MLDIYSLLQSPLSKGNAIKFLSSKRYRDEFIFNYHHFHNDDNLKIYKNWINRHIISTNNQILEHIFSLSIYISFYSRTLIKRGCVILEGRYRELTKLACLEYIFSQRNKIPQSLFVKMNKQASIHTSSPIIKFQSAFNLLFYESKDSFEKIQRLLKNTEYPTLFYRTANQLDLLDGEIKRKIKLFLINELRKKEFSKNVKKELHQKIIQGN